jgi:hypothetical protein
MFYLFSLHLVLHVPLPLYSSLFCPTVFYIVFDWVRYFVDFYLVLVVPILFDFFHFHCPAYLANHQITTMSQPTLADDCTEKKSSVDFAGSDTNSRRVEQRLRIGDDSFVKKSSGLSLVYVPNIFKIDVARPRTSSMWRPKLNNRPSVCIYYF